MQIDNQDFQIVKEIATTDEQGNLILGTVAKERVYRVMINDAGQILLDPINIPNEEKWLWQNSEAHAAVQRGREQAKVGEVHDLGSFAQYAELEIDD